MKAIIALVALLAVVGTAQAEQDQESIKRHAGQQQLSKRPYAAPVEKTDVLEGTVIDKKEVEKPKKINAFMLDRRPYVEKAGD